MFNAIKNWLAKQRWLTGALLSAAIVLIILNVLFTYQNLTQLVLERRESTAYLSSVTLEEKFNGLVNLAVSLATRVRFRALVTEGKWGEAIKILESVPRDFPDVERVFLSDASGILTADFPSLAGVVGKDFSFRDWYKGVTSTGGPHVSEIYKRTAAPQYNIVAIAAPIKSDDQQLLGIVVLQIRLDRFFDWTRAVNFGPSSIVYFIDNNGRVAGHPKYVSQGEILDYSNLDIIQKVLRGESGVKVFFDDTEGIKMVAAYHPLTAYGWGAMAIQPAKLAFQLRNRELLIVLAVDGLFLLAIFLMFYIVGYRNRTISLARQKERIFLESIGDGIVAIDRSWNITLWNKNAAKISGWSAEEVMGKPLRSILKLIREKDRSENIAFIEEAMLFGRVGFMENNTKLITKNGREILVADSAAPIFDDEGGVSGAIIIFRDASREREAQLLRSDFAYASHQMRTPVVKALWSLELSLEQKDPNMLRKNVEVAYTALKSVSKLIERLVAVSEIDQGTIVINFVKINPTTILDEAIKYIESKTVNRKINVAIDAAAAPASIETDAALFKKVLIEILNNALEYSRGGEEVKINISSQTEGVLFAISDSGIGIPASEQAFIFARFFRGHNVDTTESIGAGLGLYIAKEYLTLLGGRIWFKSEERKGTTFFILLPLAPR